MTAEDLINLLKDIPPKTQIRIYADHGQQCLMATYAGLQTIAKSDINNTCIDILDAETGEKLSKDEIDYVFEISAP